MKKSLSLFLAVVLVLLSFSAVFAEGSMNNFSQSRQYDGRFTDVKTSDWFYQYVTAAYEYGFVSGNSATTFNPNGNITIAETLVIACQMNSIYYQKEVDRSVTSPWYQPYVNYAVENGIIGSSDYANYTVAATRLQFATIMAHALPDEALLAIGNITSIPDVPKDMKNASEVYKLYNAGILSGSDEYGTFKPTSNIKRSEVSVIAINMADQSRRKAATLKTPPTEAEPSQESNSNILHKGSDYTAEFQKVWEAEGVTWAFYMDIYYTNNTSEPVTFYIQDCYVNDEKVPLVMSGMPVEIAAGKSGKGSYIISYNSLSISALKEIKTIEGTITDLEGKITAQKFVIKP